MWANDALSCVPAARPNDQLIEPDTMDMVSTDEVQGIDGADLRGLLRALSPSGGDPRGSQKKRDLHKKAPSRRGRVN